MPRWLPYAFAEIVRRPLPLSSVVRIATPRKYSLSRSNVMEKIDEESLPDYDPRSYYPAQSNETVGGSFKIKVKLGYGRTSTTWLCTDDQGAYKVLKIGRAESTRRERDAYEKLGASASFMADPRHPCVRQPESILNLVSQERTYDCFVFPPLGPNLLEYKNQLRLLNESFGSRRAKIAATYMLLALEPLHSAGMIHTDMKLDNFQITLPDPEDAYLDAFCAAEETAPSIARWNADGGLTVPRREMKQSHFTHTILCDLGSVVRVEERYQATVQALPYRAPEVILGAGWDHKIDIWSLGILVWEMIFGERLFGSSDEFQSLELMIKYLGPPPRDLLDRCKRSDDFFDKQGNWKHGTVERLELEDRIEPDTSIPDLLDFIRCALQWDPWKRPSAAQLLDHAWLAEMMRD